MTHKSPSLVTCFFLLVSLFTACQNPSPATVASPDSQVGQSLLSDLEQTLEQFRDRHDLPGVSFGFVSLEGDEGAVVAGWSDRETKAALKISDRFLAGSIGKTYVAAVALQLAGEGRLDLDALISRWLGEETWFSRLPNAEKITVRMLMNHTSGIPEHIERPEFSDAVAASPYRTWQPYELAGFVLDAEPLFPPGEAMSYADTNYIVLGMILEKITGRAYYASLKQRILEKFGLTDTVPSDNARIPGLIAGYAERPSPFKNQGKTIKQGMLVLNPQGEWTGGGLASTPLDLARWARIVYQGNAFPDALMVQALDGVPAFGRTDERYGLGVQIWNSDHGTCVGHGGWFPGYLSLMAYYQELNLAVAVQVNSDGLPNAVMEMRALLDTLAGILIQG